MLWMKVLNTYMFNIKENIAPSIFLKLRFIPCKTEQPLQGMVLQEKEAQKD